MPNLDDAMKLEDAEGPAWSAELFEPPDDTDCSLQSIVRALWLPSYGELFEAELRHNRALVGRSDHALKPSSYRARLSGEAAVRYDQRMDRQERDRLAIQLHANNMRHWSPSLVARSIAYVRLTTAWMHSVETNQRRLASRPSTMKALRLMRDSRPEVPWERGRHVFAYGFDQTYEWVGMQKRGRRQTLERVDAQGMPMAISHEVYINAIQIHLPASLGTLSPQDIAAIAANNGSPYTGDYNDLFDFLRVTSHPPSRVSQLSHAQLLPQSDSRPRTHMPTCLCCSQPTAVHGYLCEFSLDAMASVSQAAAGARVCVEQLSLRVLGNALFGRRSVDPGGPSEFDILEPLMQCDTKSYSDAIKIERHLGSHSLPSRVVDVAIGDGQSVILWKNLKCRWPMQYARWLIGVGGFHKHAHTMFGLNEMFWYCLVCWCLTFVGITKVFVVTQNLEHNNYAHVQQAHHMITLAIMAYLVQDVVAPSPSLLLRDPELYLQQVDSASAVVLVRYLQYAGFPILQWQRAAREGDGRKLKKLFAYSHHVFRSVCHKPICAQVSHYVE